jgi:uncharacterized protein with HEPN domain
MREGQDKVLLTDILSAIEWIKNHTKGINEEEFKKNDVLVYAVIKNMEIIGEASSSLSEYTINKNQQIEWQKIKDMRNVLVHAYSKINLETLWDTIINDLPRLKDQIRHIKKNE